MEHLSRLLDSAAIGEDHYTVTEEPLLPDRAIGAQSLDPRPTLRLLGLQKAPKGAPHAQNPPTAERVNRQGPTLPLLSQNTNVPVRNKSVSFSINFEIGPFSFIVDRFCLRSPT